jgi:CRP-like cAMP-binding protein
MGNMEKYLPLLQTTSLFSGIKTDDLRPLLRSLGAVVRRYGKGETLVFAGRTNRYIGIVLTGSIEAVRPTPGGLLVPITHMDAGGIFGDVLSGSTMSSPVTVTAREACDVLLIQYDRLLSLTSDSNPAQLTALKNLVRTVSDKYFMLSRRVDLLVLKTLRSKVCAYLLGESEHAGSLTFTIPYSRIQLADYLNCDRSALSRELSQMQREGLLDTYRSSFKLLNPEALRREV